MILEERNITKRLFEEDDFISDILSLIHVPNHRLDDDNEVDDVPEEVKRTYFKCTDRVYDVEELKKRLNAKMEGLKGSSGGKLKNKLTKVEKKQKRKEEKKLKAKLARINDSTGMSNGLSSLDEAKNKRIPSKPVYNSGGKMVFSKFDFTEENGNALEETKFKTQLDPKAALKKIEARREKMKALKEVGKTERVKELEEKSVWKSAIAKASGAKIKDDETLLKKSIKKMESRKKSSKKKWEARSSAEEKRSEVKQKKRTENINKRKSDKKEKKMKRAIKKGRALPGFQ